MANNRILARFMLIYVSLILVGGIICYKIFVIQFYNKKEIIDENIQYRVREVKAIRGDIYSDDYSLLATSVPLYKLYFDSKTLRVKDSLFKSQLNPLCKKLASYLKEKKKSYRDYRNDIKNAIKNEKEYYLIADNLTYEQKDSIQKFPLIKLGRYKTGFMFDRIYIRTKPFKDLASRIIGNINKGAAGNIVGLEGAYDNILSGVNGKALMYYVGKGKWVKVEDKNYMEPENGKHIISTIDVNIQDIAHEALKKMLVEQNAEYGTVIVMDVKTGAIKAMSNLGIKNNGRYGEIYNYAIGQRTEPGSTFKLASLLAALEDGYINLKDKVDVEKGSKKYYDQWMHDSEYEKDVISVKKAFAISSNVGISKIVNENYKNKEDQFTRKLYRFKLYERLGVEIRGEEDPIIAEKGSGNWSAISLPWMAIGYGVSLSPLQILSFYNSIANDGYYVKPYFVSKIVKNGRIMKDLEKEIPKTSICNTTALKQAQDMLREVVVSGTARKAFNNIGFSVSGKTGTTVTNYSRKKKDEKKQYQASFVGYFPSENPQYSCIVIVNEPKTSKYAGASVAAPVFVDIAERIYRNEVNTGTVLAKSKKAKIPYTKSGNRADLETALSILNIPFEHKGEDSSPWISSNYTEKRVETRNRSVRTSVVPNVVGMGIQDAIFILENLGLKVAVKGRGAVSEQSIRPGKKVKKGSKVLLKLG